MERYLSPLWIHLWRLTGVDKLEVSSRKRTMERAQRLEERDEGTGITMGVWWGGAPTEKKEMKGRIQQLGPEALTRGKEDSGGEEERDVKEYTLFSWTFSVWGNVFSLKLKQQRSNLQ